MAINHLHLSSDAMSLYITIWHSCIRRASRLAGMGLSEPLQKTSPLPSFGSRQTAVKSPSELAGTRPKKYQNNGVFSNDSHERYFAQRICF
jgi:hypothetical protein